jgi:hypothetical protein
MSYSVLSVHLSVAEPFGILPPLEHLHSMRNSINPGIVPASPIQKVLSSCHLPCGITLMPILRPPIVGLLTGT